MAQIKKRIPESLKKEKNGTESSTEKKTAASSFMLIMGFVFVILIGYTVWSSVMTYSENFVHDFE